MKPISLIALVTVSALVIITVAIYLFSPQTINVSPVDHEVIVYYEDGTTSTIQPLRVTYYGKKIDDIGYEISP